MNQPVRIRACARGKWAEEMCARVYGKYRLVHETRREASQEVARVLNTLKRHTSPLNNRRGVHIIEETRYEKCGTFWVYIVKEN